MNFLHLRFAWSVEHMQFEMLSSWTATKCHDVYSNKALKLFVFRHSAYMKANLNAMHQCASCTEVAYNNLFGRVP